MSRILIASTPLVGHVSPMLFVAEALKEQGHDVLFLTGETFRERVTRSGIEFTSLSGYANYDWAKLESLFTPEEAAAQGLEGHIIHLKRLFADCIPDQYQAMEFASRKQGSQLILIDVLYMGALPLLLRRGERPPIVSCGVVAPMWRDPGFSPFAGADASPEGQRRNIEDGRKFDAAVSPGTRYIDEVLTKLGVSVEGGFRMFDTMYRLPDRFLQLGAEEFEYPLVERRANLRFVGPILPRTTEKVVAPDWLQNIDATRPLIFITQGTLANTNFDQLLNPVLEALEQEPVRVVATAGGGNDQRIRKTANALILPYVPYEDILPRTSIFITNGGYNGVQHALRYGVPIIAAGSTEDKPYVAARVAWSGAGLDLKTATPSPDQVRNAVRTVLLDTCFRQRARALRANIEQLDALATIGEQVRDILSQGDSQ